MNVATPSTTRITTGVIAGLANGAAAGILQGYTAAFTTAGEILITETVGGRLLAAISSDGSNNHFAPCGYKAGGLTVTLSGGGVLAGFVVYTS